MYFHARLIFIYIKTIFFLSLISCSSFEGAATSQAFNSCKVAERCQLKGRLEIYVGSSGSVGVLNGREECIALALPKTIYENKTSWEKRVVVEGKAYSQHSAQGVISYQIKDRWVAVGLCETGVILYVDKIK